MARYPKSTGSKQSKKKKSTFQRNASDSQSGPSRRDEVKIRKRNLSPHHTAPGRKQNSRKHLPEDDSTTNSQSYDTGSSSTETNGVVLRKVGARSVKKWKPLSDSTKQFVLQLLDTGTNMLLCRTTVYMYDDIKAHLEAVRKKLETKMGRTIGPVCRVTDYNSLHKLLKTGTPEPEPTIADGLEQQIEEEHRLCEKLEEELEQFKAYESSGSQLHPLLQTGEAVPDQTD